jgi:hypothetical protein
MIPRLGYDKYDKLDLHHVDVGTVVKKEFGEGILRYVAGYIVYKPCANIPL